MEELTKEEIKDNRLTFDDLPEEVRLRNDSWECSMVLQFMINCRELDRQKNG